MVHRMISSRKLFVAFANSIWGPGSGRKYACFLRSKEDQSARSIDSLSQKKEHYSGLAGGEDLVTLDVGSDGVGCIFLNSPPVNALTFSVLTSLKEKFEDAIRRSDVRAVVLSGFRGRFSAGFDIKAIKELQATGDSSVMSRVSFDLMTHTIEEASKPSVAAIDGLALGGGLELAMACSSRLSTANAQLGLPELTLGVIPAFGGTQRLPRLVGVWKACEMIMSSEPISGEGAHRVGLVDGLYSSEDLLSASRQCAVDMAEGRRPRLVSLTRTDKLENLSAAQEIIKRARVHEKRENPNLFHPHIALDAIEEGILKGGYAGAFKEAEGFTKTVFADNSRALIHVFFARRSVTKVTGITDQGLKPQEIKQVAVVGGGVMGSEIITALALSGIRVFLKEKSSTSLQAALSRIKANLQSQMKGKTPEEVEKPFSLVEGRLDYKKFESADAAIEAVHEQIELKQDIFADLEKFTSPNCVLATFTSSIVLRSIAAKIKPHDRVVGARFFSPVHTTPLLEVVRTENSSPQSVVDILHLGKLLKKTPLVVGNCIGGAFNRLFSAYNMAAGLLLDLGVDLYRIDAVIKAFGMPTGPFSFADLVGLDIAVAACSQHMHAYPDRGYESQIWSLLIKAGRLGKNNGEGIYRYDERCTAEPDPEIRPYVEEARQLGSIKSSDGPLILTDREIVEMLFFPVVNESARLLEERVVLQAADLDIATVVGMGFPSYRGGIAFWADLVGVKYIVERLQDWSELHGNIFKPCDHLVHRAANGAKLSDPLGQVGSNSKL